MRHCGHAASSRREPPHTALKYGLVEDESAKRAKKREWANRYAERTGRNTYDEDGYEDEQGASLLHSKQQEQG